eukprot:GHVO01032684.1.p1 GENE.GHVO01032684.1~~GHVO01032684.1.p1  ORF type:complete len:214 (+),score=25.64 GHVO01032684.1:140-781(+)
MTTTAGRKRRPLIANAVIGYGQVRLQHLTPDEVCESLLSTFETLEFRAAKDELWKAIEDEGSDGLKFIGDKQNGNDSSSRTTAEAHCKDYKALKELVDACRSPARDRGECQGFYGAAASCTPARYLPSEASGALGSARVKHRGGAASIAACCAGYSEHHPRDPEDDGGCAGSATSPAGRACVPRAKVIDTLRPSQARCDDPVASKSHSTGSAR